MRTFFNIYRNILLVIAVLLALVMILPLAFQIKPYIVLSPSMEPTIHTGDVCYIQEYKEGEKPEIGSIVAFVLNDNKTMFVHRVVDIKNDTYITQGDANDTVDLYQPTDETIVGKAVFIIPYLGTIVSWVKTPQGLIVMGVAVLISILSSFLDTEKKDNKKRKNNKDNNKADGYQSDEDITLFVQKYEEVKTENSTKPRSLSDLVKERRSVRDEIIKQEQNEWIEDIFEKDFEEIKEPETQLDENITINSENNNTNSENIEKDIENTEKDTDNNDVEEVVYDFENMSVEDETRKIIEKYSAETSETGNKDDDITVAELSKIGLNDIQDENITDDEDEELFNVSKYIEKYLGEEANDITADTSLFDTDGISIDTKDWTFMVDDKDNSEFTERYRESVIKSVKRKLESETYNDSDNFSPAAILKRAQEALKDDLTDEENDIMNILTIDDIKIDVNDDGDNDAVVDVENEEKPE